MTTAHQEYVEDTTGETPHAGAPVDVRIVDAVRVQEFPSRSWSPAQLNVGTAPVQIAAPHHARTQLRVTNTGTTTVYLGPAQSNCTVTSGYPLAPGEALTLETRAAVWAICADAGTLATLAQFKDG